LHHKRFYFSDGFVRKLVEITEGMISSEVFEKVLSMLESEASKYYFTSSSEANLLRIFSSIYDRTFFFQEISKYPHHGEIIIAIAASSNYLTDIVVLTPEYLYQIFDQAYLLKDYNYAEIEKEVFEGANRFKSLYGKINYLRQVKKRFILKIGLTDILRLKDLISVTQQLSYLAKAINAKLFATCYNEILNKYKIENINHKYCMCSLGKLGGNELNYSSDVDLILFYDFNETINGIHKDYHEILSEAVQLFIKSSTEISAHGNIYRIDFRLRPDGKYSPLCKTLTDYIKYYETRGEDWEKQMLIKLDFICGDRMLYKQFNDFAQSYIYSSSLSSSVKEKIRQMKLNIERHNCEKENIKVFSGGIRDIEFSIQALQMLNEKKIKSLQSGNSLETIDRLFEKNLLKKNEKKIFTEAYIFYRKIEHFLQLMNNTQTHLIPEDKDLLNKLVNYTKSGTLKLFRERINSYRKGVRNIYNEILSSKEDDAEDILFTGVKFKDVTNAKKNLTFLQSGAGIFEKKEFDSRTIETYSKIEPQLIKNIVSSSDPDKILENLAKIIRNSKFPSIWYSEFANQKFLENFLILCSKSQKTIDLLSTNSSLEEFYLSRKVFIKNPVDTIEDFSLNEIILLTSVQFALGLMDAFCVAQLLSLSVENKLKNNYRTANLSYTFFVGGLGSFGCSTMNFSSDIDLIIVADDVDENPNIQKDFQKFISNLREELKPFEMDLRLRPEGKSSPLIRDIKNYKEYLQKRARVWEFQSLLKLRFICGNEALFNKFLKTLFEQMKILDSSSIRNEIRSMYSSIQRQTTPLSHGEFNIKKENGGIITIDFILQSLCLSDYPLYEKTNGKSLLRILSSLKKKFNETEFKTLDSNLKFLKRLELSVQNIFNTSNAIIPALIEKKNLLAVSLGIKNHSELNKKISEVRKSNIKLLEKYLGK